MAILVITTHRGARYEAEVRDAREANSELARFSRQYLANHPNDRIIDASVLARGNIIARHHNGRLEDF